VYFQARETVNPYYESVPGLVESAMRTLGTLTGRRYGLFDYHGHPEAERVIVTMGSSAETVRETVAELQAQGERVGLVQVRLYRPLSAARLLLALPPTTRAIAVLDRCKEPGAPGEPLYLDVANVVNEAAAADALPMDETPVVIGGRYGLSSKEFTPAMAKAVLDELKHAAPNNHFTIGIDDDVSGTSLAFDPGWAIEANDTVRAVFHGLGADGTVGANKNSIKIIGHDPAVHAQAYFVYDSKKSGSRTVSHLRFGPHPIRAPYLVQAANFVGCHQFGFLTQTDVLRNAAPGATFLLNSPHDRTTVWDHLPAAVRRRIVELKLKFFVIDAYGVAAAAGLGRRINTIMQTCFFKLAGVMPVADAIAEIKGAIERSYARKGREVVEQNCAAVDATLAALEEVEVPATAGEDDEATTGLVPDEAPEFVQRVTAVMMADRGDTLPVSALPADGTWPSGTSRWEHRDLSREIPQWDSALCIQCGNCALVCPHAVIRAKFFPAAALAEAPAGFPSAHLRGRGFPETRYSLQIHPDQCTGCTLCVDACPARDPAQPGRRAINMTEKAPVLEQQREWLGFFESLPEPRRGRVDFSTVRGVQHLTPLFEFPGACAGCGETPYVRLVSQLFGDRAVIANATGCSSIYGGNLPTTPWAANAEGRGPAWSNSLFEDNAEFGFGFRLSADTQRHQAETLLRQLAHKLGADFVTELLEADQSREAGIRDQRRRLDELRRRLADIEDPAAEHLAAVAEHLVRRSVWIIGGDGWAYDIGYGGLDHVLSMGRDVNVLVLDTEVYSNTGGQVSKATPLGAVAKFAAGGKPNSKKDLALQAIAYGNVYVARVALGANPQQALLAFREAERYPGPSLILAYSHCIAHGIDMRHGLAQQHAAVTSGHWPLLRYNPVLRDEGRNPFLLDSQRPREPLAEFAGREVRFRILESTNPQGAAELMRRAQEDVAVRWGIYEEMASRGDAAFRFGREAASGAGAVTSEGTQ
jgi:pyruvate-ferredoxin/flavodoxin oxidoreductase